ncbi:MAG: hypothetical protein PHX92_02855 [Candidatus Pacebacteria bacterium]|nr:hypothetical protein [Candidatus Paceibacterota bacterium]
MNQKITTQQIKESAKRNDIRSIESFLKDDLRNCSDFVQGQPEDEFLYKVNLCSSEQVEYVKNQDELGLYFISRSIGSEKIDFRDIKNIELSNPGNSKLIDVKIYTTDNNDEDYLHELKIARWEWELNRGEDSYYDFIKDEGLFVQGQSIDVKNGGVKLKNNSTSPSTILLRGSFSPSGGKFSVEGPNLKVFIDGNVDLKNNHKLNDVELYVKGDISFSNNTTFSGSVYSSGKITRIPAGVDYYENYPVEIPVSSVPVIQEDQWFIDKGYSNSLIGLSTGSRVVVEQNKVIINSNSLENIVIVNKTGDISISGDSFSGVVYAPNGSVKISENLEFKGVIIAEEQVMIEAQSEMIFENISTYLSEEDYPFKNG